MPRRLSLEQLALKRKHCLNKEQLMHIVDQLAHGFTVKSLALDMGFSPSAIRAAPRRLAAMGMEMLKQTQPELPLYDGARDRVEAALNPMLRRAEPDPVVRAGTAVPEREEEPALPWVFRVADLHWRLGLPVSKIAADHALNEAYVRTCLVQVSEMCLKRPDAVPPGLYKAWQESRIKLKDRYLSKIPPKTEAKRDMIYGKNVLIQHKCVAGITATVYVEAAGLTQPPDNDWWLQAAVAKLALVMESGMQVPADHWVLVRVG